MPEPENVENRGDRQPADIKTKTYYVNFASTIILGITMVAVIAYAFQACRQSNAIQESVEVATRPILEVYIIPNETVQEVTKPSEKGYRDFDTGEKVIKTVGLSFQLLNTGKLPTNAQIWTVVKYSSAPLKAAPSLDSVEHSVRFIWPATTPYENLQALGDDPMTPGQFNDIRQGVGFIYFRIKIEYGSYRTGICWAFAINKLLGTIGRFENCPGHSKITIMAIRVVAAAAISAGSDHAI